MPWSNWGTWSPLLKPHSNSIAFQVNTYVQRKVRKACPIPFSVFWVKKTQCQHKVHFSTTPAGCWEEKNFDLIQRLGAWLSVLGNTTNFILWMLFYFFCSTFCKCIIFMDLQIWRKEVFFLKYWRSESENHPCKFILLPNSPLDVEKFWVKRRKIFSEAPQFRIQSSHSK